jgi:alcohol dehydrogenase (cytochrome c)
VLEAIDVTTGAIKWTHAYEGAGQGNTGPGILTTAGGLLFTGSNGANLVAHDPATGRILWHQRLTRAVSNGPSTWMLDGAQYLVVGAADTLYAFRLPSERK